MSHEGALPFSVVGFVLIWLQAGTSPPLRSIAAADLIGFPFLSLEGWQAFGMVG